MNKSFKERREAEENKKSLLENNPEFKKVLKNHINLKEGLSDNALVSLIVFINGHDLNEGCLEELKLFKYIDDINKLTEEGKTFIDSEETIKRLKEMIA